jgi:hypothetical protein
MAVKVGNSWVSEAALAYAKEKANADTDSILEDLSKQYPEVNFSTNTAPFSQSGVKNIQISPNILTEMKNDPEKRLEYEALIYDCATGIDMLNQSGGGFHTKAAGFIINPDGSLGGWGISVSDDDGTKAKSKVSLDKNKKETWAEKIRKKQKEKIAEAKKETKLRAQKESAKKESKEAKAMQQKEKLEDAYYQRFDVEV